MTARAKVILKGAKTYTFQGKRWIKDVPGIVHGSDSVKAYQENGYFHTTVLKAKKKKKKKSEDDDDKKSKDKGKLKK